MKSTGNDDLSASIYRQGDASIPKQRLIREVKMPGQTADFMRTTCDSATPTAWYALQVRPRFEKIVATHLDYKGYEEYLPLYRSRRKWSDRIKEVDLPLFPGYIFCKFDIRQRLPILVIPGVMSVVGLGKNPAAVPDDEIAAVQNVAKSGLTYEPSGFISTGQRARIERGPLQGLVGIVVAVKKNYRLIISVNLLQRSVAVEIDNDSVMPLCLDNHRAAIAGA